MADKTHTPSVKQTFIVNNIDEIQPDQNNPGKQVFQTPDGKVLKTLLVTGLDSNVEAQWENDCNVNRLLKRAQDKGLLRATATFQGDMDDLPQMNFRDAQIALAKAASYLESLPPDIRQTFKNDPVYFADFCQNPDNAPKLVEMGLAKLVDGVDGQGQTINMSNGTPVANVVAEPQSLPADPQPGTTPPVEPPA